MKTNNQWYPFPGQGSYFKLEEGKLYQSPMNADGTRDDTPAWVDFNFIDEPTDAPALRAIIKDLELRK